MKITIHYEGNEEMHDMVVHVNSDGLQKIMNIIMDEKHIVVSRITQRAPDSLSAVGTDNESTGWSCKNCGWLNGELWQECPNCKTPRG